ncbi:MAG TPA: hypothetical protein VKE40_00395 [Gemmataceae bacterium]|nr:hypothetical protein [Gemmataceae bacterium]
MAWAAILMLLTFLPVAGGIGYAVHGLAVGQLRVTRSLLLQGQACDLVCLGVFTVAAVYGWAFIQLWAVYVP